MRRATILLAMLIGFASLAAHAAGDPAAGKKKTTTCAACHGPTGVSTQPIYPNLCGQKEQYLVIQLQAFKSGKRENPIMKPMVAGLSDQDMQDLAAYFSSQECK